MKSCEEYIADMNLSIDGLLEPEEEQALQAHLAVCPKCRSLYQSYREIQSAIQEAEAEPPKGLSHSVMTQIRQEKVRHSPKATLKRMRFTLVAAVIAVVVITAGKYIGSPGRNLSSGTTAAQAEAANEAAAAEPETAFAAAPEETQPEAKTGTGTTEGTDEFENAAPMLGADYSAAENAAPSATPMDSTLIIWNALKQDGYVGPLYVVKATETQLFQLLPQAEIIVLSSGDTVYHVSAADYQLVEEQLPAVQEMENDSQSDEVYLSLFTE